MSVSNSYTTKFSTVLVQLSGATKFVSREFDCYFLKDFIGRSMKPRNRLCLVLKLRMTGASVEPSLSSTVCHLITVCIVHKYMPRRYKLHHFTLWSVILCLATKLWWRYHPFVLHSDDLLAVSRQTDGKKQEDRFYVQNVCRQHWELLYKSCRSSFIACLCCCWKTEKLINVD
jgi:hypothetical protein